MPSPEREQRDTPGDATGMALGASRSEPTPELHEGSRIEAARRDRGIGHAGAGLVEAFLTTGESGGRS